MFVHLPLRNEAQLEVLVQQQSTEGSPNYHHWLTPQQFRAAYGPRIEDLRNAALTLRSEGFTTTITSQGIFADAPQSVIEHAFGVHLRASSLPSIAGVSTGNKTALVADRAPTLPAVLTKLNAQVVGLSATPVNMPEIYKVRLNNIPENRYSPTGPYWFDDLKQAYEWPSFTTADGRGRAIGIISTSDFLDSDYQTYFAHEHLAPPTVIRKPVSGGPPPFDVNSPNSDEVTLDIQQAGGMAPGATLYLYGGPDDSDASFAGMYVQIDEDNIVDIVNTSFGSCELFYTPAYQGTPAYGGPLGILRVFHQLWLQGNSQGITFFNSSGDNGAKGCLTPDLKTAIFGVNNLASDPAVTGVGGTNLVTVHNAPSLNSAYVSENAFYDKFKPGTAPYGEIWGSGGGKSVIWPKPPYQYLVNTHSSTRAVPDVALHMGGLCAFAGAAEPPCGPDRSADVLVLDGLGYGAIGTSASSPDMAGLQAVREQAIGSGREGNVNYVLYSLARAGTLGNGLIFRRNIAGNNGYPSEPGYDFVTGLGSVRGSQYALRPFGPFAGIPQTPSNP
ncbi:MAG: S8/S53 family peptidase [Candidatus Eremiobacteraeota bacterium]|nr:S8/S53 family peptidase [Candidatus Eremiobacteraeota bacterium]